MKATLAKNIIVGILVAVAVTASAIVQDEGTVAGLSDPLSEPRLMQGKPVQFIYGSGVNSYNLQRVVENVQESGCPVTTRQLSSTDRIIVKVDGRTAGTEDPVFAGMLALKYCLK